MKHKRLISLLLAMIMLLAVPIGVFAEEPEPSNLTGIAVKFDLNGGKASEGNEGAYAEQSVIIDERVTKPVDPEKEGYEFKGWTLGGKDFDFAETLESNGVGEDKTEITLVAKWEANSPDPVKVTVKFNLDGGVAEQGNENIYVNQIVEIDKQVRKPADPIKGNSEFKGWTLNGKDFDFAKTLKENGVAEDATEIELVAKWGADTPAQTKVTVKFDLSGGEATESNNNAYADQEITIDGQVRKPADPIKDNNEFKGWTLNGKDFDFAKTLEGNGVGEDATEITLVAKWEANTPAPAEQVTITFEANGGTGEMESKTVNKGSEITLPANGFTAPNTNQEFKAWEVNGTEKTPGAEIIVNGNTTVKALWQAKPAEMVTVSFVTNGGNSLSPLKLTKGYVIHQPVVSRDGYTFEGWYKEKDLTNKVTFPLTVNEDMTLYAKWSKDESKSKSLDIDKRYYSGGYFYGTVRDGKDNRVAYADVYLYDDDRSGYIRSVEADKDGDFKIKLDYRYYDDDDYGYYDGYRVYYDKYDDEYYYYKNGTKHYLNDWHGHRYYRGYRDLYLVAKKSGYDNSSKYYLDDKYYDDYWHDGKYYNGKYSLTPSIESAYAGEKNVKGSAGDYADITVYDDDGYKLGTATADRDGDFTVYLDRALKYGEKIKVEAKDGSRYSSSTTYTVKYKDSTDVTSFVRPAYIKGYPDGTFKPGATITRAEAVKMFVGLINNGKDVAHSSNTGFSDADNMWYSSVIKYAVDKGYIKGYGDGTFKPNEEITRAEFAAMISKFVDKGYPGSTNFKDIKGHWASDAISALYGNKNIKGYPDGTFKPNSKLTRAEAVTILNSVFGRDTRVNSLYNINTSGLKTFSDVSSGYWAYYEILDASNTHSTSKVGTDGFEVWK